jgi:hypothetical protein
MNEVMSPRGETVTGAAAVVVADVDPDRSEVLFATGATTAASESRTLVRQE